MTEKHFARLQSESFRSACLSQCANRWLGIHRICSSATQGDVFRATEVAEWARVDNGPARNDASYVSRCRW